MLTKIIFSLLVLLLSTASTIPQTKVFNSTRDQAESPIAINPTNSNNLIVAIGSRTANILTNALVLVGRN